MGIRWEDATAVQVLNDTSSELVLNQSGPYGGLVPLSLTHEPDLRGIVEAVDFDTLTPP